MGIRFDALSKPEQLAVADHVRRQYESIASLQPETYVSRNAKTDPGRWQDGLRELIASDPKRVENIVEAAQRECKVNVRGFTLIELSIVLVIVGLIVGGVLVGQDLIRAAGVRATISQIERFNTAANTFRGKYGYLPGDIKDPDASSFGLQARGNCPGQGDGNGIIEGSLTSTCAAYPWSQSEGETLMFWVDLSTAHLIEGGFNTAQPTGLYTSITATSTPSLNAFFPTAKIGRGNFIYIYAGSSSYGSVTGTNYYGLSALTAVTNSGAPPSNPALTVQEAYSIDSKIDDGLPQTGRVTAEYLNLAPTAVWSSGLPFAGGVGFAIPLTTTAAQVGSASTCWDNGGNAGTQETYSVEISGGSNVNCALSFQMQAGD